MDAAEILSVESENREARIDRFAKIVGNLSARLSLHPKAELIPSNVCTEGELPTIVVPEDLADKTLRSTDISF